MSSPCRSCRLATCPGNAYPMAHRYCGRAPELAHQRGRDCCLLTRSTNGGTEGEAQILFREVIREGDLFPVVVLRAAVRRRNGC